MINNFFSQSNSDSKMGFDQYFRNNFVNENEFYEFLQRIGVNMSMYDQDFKTVFGYFKI